MTSVFHIVKGNHGATYILNLKNWASIRYSLKFYKATSLKVKLYKRAFHLYLFIKSQLSSNSLKSAKVINNILQNSSKINTNFNIDSDCSVLLSPTKDKIIVHHHQQYFQKFAFSNSYSKVKKEAQIYALFNRPLTHFQVSNYHDEIDETDTIISFKLSIPHIDTKVTTLKPETLVLLLTEFFNIVSYKKLTIKTHVANLKNQLQQRSNKIYENQLQVLDDLQLKDGALAFPLGLVHRDFKHWNILDYKKPLVFDFEETTDEGLPLEDMLNYNIAPLVRFEKTKKVVLLALNNDKLKQYRVYLERLNISIEFTVFLHLYLIERILFFNNSNEIEVSEKYLDLSNYLIEIKWK